MLLSARQGAVLVVRFFRPPGTETDRAVRALMDEAWAATREPVTFIAILPDAATVAAGALRERLTARSQESTPPTASVHLVVEGDHPQARLRRTAFTAMGRLATGYRFRVHARCERALMAAAAERSVDLSPLFVEARARGVLPTRSKSLAQPSAISARTAP